MTITSFESGSSFPPLPLAEAGREVTRSETFIDIEILGSLVGNDIYSSNWDGEIPLNIDDDGDSSATLGYGLDASTGQIQAARLFVAPGTLATPAVSYIEDATTGHYFFTSAQGPSGGNGAIGAVCSGGATWTLNNDGSGPGTFAVIGHIHAAGGSEGRFRYTNLPSGQTATSAVLWWNGTYYEIVPTSSTVRGKRDIRDHPQLADIELKPKKYIHKASGNEEYGLTVEDLVQQDPKIGIWDDNVKRYNDYQDRAVIAVLAAKANKSSDDVAVLRDDVAALTATVATLLDRVTELESRLAETPLGGPPT